MAYQMILIWCVSLAPLWPTATGQAAPTQPCPPQSSCLNATSIYSLLQLAYFSPYYGIIIANSTINSQFDSYCDTYYKIDNNPTFLVIRSVILFNGNVLYTKYLLTRNTRKSVTYVGIRGAPTAVTPSVGIQYNINTTSCYGYQSGSSCCQSNSGCQSSSCSQSNTCCQSSCGSQCNSCSGTISSNKVVMYGFYACPLFSNCNSSSSYGTVLASSVGSPYPPSGCVEQTKAQLLSFAPPGSTYIQLPYKYPCQCVTKFGGRNAINYDSVNDCLRTSLE